MVPAFCPGLGRTVLKREQVFMRLTIQQKVQAGFAVALVFLLLTGVAAFWTHVESRKTARLVSHTYLVLNRLNSTLTAMLNIETATRAYVAVKDEAFLQSYQPGIQDARNSVQELRQLLADNSVQQRRLAELEPLIS